MRREMKKNTMKRMEGSRSEDRGSQKTRNGLNFPGTGERAKGKKKRRKRP